MRKNRFKTPSKSSPKSGRRGCLCPDGTYSVDCCDGSLQAQGIGNVTRVLFRLLTEDNDKFVQEQGHKLFQ